MSVQDLEKAFKTAKKAWKANKEDKSLKKAMKAAKAAFEAAQAAPAEEAPSKKRKAESEPEEVAESPKKAKVDIEALKKAVKDAKKANKAAGKTAESKKALKAAKKALADAEGASGEEAAATEEAEPAAEAEAEAEAETEEAAADPLAGLKKPKPQDPNACERLFCGNLSWDIDDDGIKAFFEDCGTLNDIYWLEDRDTGKFRGIGFITFDTVEMAVKAMEKNGQELLGREIRLDYSPRNNNRGASKGGSKGGKGGGKRELSEKPEGCTTVFCGNLSFDIDDDKMAEFAKSAGCGEVKAIRWLTDRDSGDFKGCGFVEFYDTADVDAIVKKNGEDLLGRAIRLDYSKPREKKW